MAISHTLNNARYENLKKKRLKESTEELKMLIFYLKLNTINIIYIPATVSQI
jgi:hypothetical protein